jgi:DNA-binding transcriptional ArsR family regulator
MAFLDRFRRQKQETKKKTRKKKPSKAKKAVSEPVKTKPKTKLTHVDELINWKNLVNTVQDHPLSQARVLNTQLLEQLTNVLDSIDTRLKDLSKLDEVLDLLKQEKADLEASGKHSERLDKAILELERATIKDRDAIKILKKEPMTAEKLASELKISRSTASSRLNRLYSLGAVDKYAEGKNIYYKIHD